MRAGGATVRALVTAIAEPPGPVHLDLFAEDSPSYALLESWLEERPDWQLLDAWTRYVRLLVRRLDERDREALRDRIVDLARKVADAAGGTLGIGRISEREKEALDAVAAAFVPE